MCRKLLGAGVGRNNPASAKMAAGPSTLFYVSGACEPKSTPEMALKNRVFSL